MIFVIGRVDRMPKIRKRDRTHQVQVASTEVNPETLQEIVRNVKELV